MAITTNRSVKRAMFGLVGALEIVCSHLEMAGNQSRQRRRIAASSATIHTLKRPFVMHWNIADQCFEVHGSAFYDETPTHWMSLPAFPGQ